MEGIKKKIKVTKGVFVGSPKCIKCGGNVSHKWLDGDYTLLICSEKCYQVYVEQCYKDKYGDD